MPDPPRCPRCGEVVDTQAPGGSLCPRCLLRLGLEPEADLTHCPGCSVSLSPGTAACPSCGLDLVSRQPTSGAEGPRGNVPVDADIGEFRIVRVLGRGGMGTVYLARQASMQRHVALKVLDAGIMPSPREISRFEREAWIAGRLNHPGLVKVFAQGEVEGRRYIAMELVEGGSLHEEIQRARESGEEKTSSASSSRRARVRAMVELFAGAADALEHVHAQGIVHRDIKPLNLLLTADRSRLLLTDFGLARDTEASRITRRGDFMGTIRYMSPEQLLAHRVEVDHRSDIYSLGVSLYEAVTLELPYAGDSEEAYISAVSTKEPAPARNHGRGVPRDLETVLMKCLERDPERRYTSAAELRDDLGRILEDRPVLAKRPGLLRRAGSLVRRNRGAVAAGVAVAVVAGIVAGVAAVRMEKIRDLARIRSTLERSIALDKAPADIEPDWERLRPLLREQLARDPEGDLLTLVLLASCCFVSFDFPEFGLISDPPTWAWTISTRSNLASDLNMATTGEPLARMEIEGAWDGGPWTRLPISYSFPVSRDARFGATGRKPLSALLSADQLSPGPHELRVRYRTRFSIPPEQVTEGSLDTYEPVFGDWNSVQSVIREPESFNISLFESYPSDFPRVVIDDELTESTLEAFGIERLRIIRVDLTKGKGPGFRLEVNGDVLFEGCVPYGQDGHKELLAGLIILGSLPSAPPVPIASKAMVFLDTEPTPLTVFSMAIKRGIQLVYGRRRDLSRLDTPFFQSSERSSPILELTIRIDAISSRTEVSEIRDGTYPGRLQLQPSREIALETKRFTHYLGEALVIPVPVTIETRQGEWADIEDCEEDVPGPESSTG